MSYDWYLINISKLNVDHFTFWSWLPIKTVSVSLCCKANIWNKDKPKKDISGYLFESKLNQYFFLKGVATINKSSAKIIQNGRFSWSDRVFIAICLILVEAVAYEAYFFLILLIFHLPCPSIQFTMSFRWNAHYSYDLVFWTKMTR